MKFTIDKTQFLNGITYNSEFGMEDMYGTDLYREYGYMAGGYQGVNVTSSSITSTISYIVNDNINDSSTSLSWLTMNDKVFRYNIDTGKIDASVTTAANYGNNGAALMKDVLYLGSRGITNVIGKLTVRGGTMGTFTSNWKTIKYAHYKEMIPFKDVIYGCNRDSIFMISDSATLSGSALVLESNTTAVSLAPYGEFLAIGSLKGKYNPSQGTGAGDGLFRSKLYFWDTTSTSWDKDRSTDIEGRILKVINKKGVLFVFVKERNDSISINYFDGNAIQPIKRITPKEGTSILDIRPDAFDVKGDSIYFGAGYSGETVGRILQYGKGEADAPISISNPYIVFPPSVAGVQSIDSVKWTKDNELTVSITDTASGHSLKVFKPGNYYMAFEPKTPTMQTGTKQICNKIKINFKPFVSGDRMYIYRNIDNGGFESSVWDSCSYTTLTGNKDHYTITREFEFNTLQLKFTGNPGTAGANSGNVRIRNVIVDTENSDEI